MTENSAEVDFANSDRLGLKFYRKELRCFVQMGVPLSLTYLFLSLQTQVAVAFAGHRSKEELGALGLAISYYGLAVTCLATALGNAFSGRFGAAFGAKRFDLLRDDLHRGLLIGLLILLGVHIFKQISCFFLPPLAAVIASEENNVNNYYATSISVRLIDLYLRPVIRDFL